MGEGLSDTQGVCDFEAVKNFPKVHLEREKGAGEGGGCRSELGKHWGRWRWHRKMKEDIASLWWGRGAGVFGSGGWNLRGLPVADGGVVGSNVVEEVVGWIREGVCDSSSIGMDS
ncbi:hypothetical protein Acr_02g0001040 [Actinidia rufa]|uniref:Uncharacterized protein n=1 Tax=Actinidia rufa TaxID=165716 RepID=A0A7J0E5S7_9ERIC|nr:hypothetical protein Acr_02g0001040 [Actinidia rufa]